MLYTILGILVGFVGGGVAIGLAVPNAPKIVLISLLTLATVVGAGLGLLLAKKVNEFDKSPVESLRLNFIIIGLLSIVLLGFATVGIVQIGVSPVIAVFGLIYVVLFAVGYLYYGFNLHLHLTPTRVKYVKAFLIIQLVAILIFAVISGATADWSSVIIQAAILFYFYRKLQQFSKSTDTPIVTQSSQSSAA